MSYADEAKFHIGFGMTHRHERALATFSSLIARWSARREHKRRVRYASFGLSDDVLRDIGVNRSQIMAAEFATRNS